MQVHREKQRVPPRALAISLASMVIPVATVFWLPDWTSSGLGTLVWLTALIPAFLLAYYRGLSGVAVALSGGMAVITATQISVVLFEIADPDWGLLLAIVGVYLIVSLGIATLAELLRRERRIAEEMAMIDRLTGLPNRRHADVALEANFAGAERGKSLTVVMFDLDRFKLVNDNHGHAAGDQALRVFADVLKATTRKENLSARFGGEEFVSVLRDCDAGAGEIFAKRVLDTMRTRSFPWGAQTVSAGVAEYQKGMGSYELLLSAADRALYDAKEGGRDRVCVAPRYDPQIGVTFQRVSVTGIKIPEEAALPQDTGKTVYVVDDDDGLRRALTRVLQRGGYKTWDTGDPFRAVQHFAESTQAERPELILTDIIMPGMSGMTMIDRIANLDPEIRVVYMSGYVQSKMSWAGVPGSIVAFLEKPIEMEKLLGTLQRVIQSEPIPDLKRQSVSR